MKRLVPDNSGSVTALDLARADFRKADGRPWVMVNFVTSIDGATTLHGESTDIGDDDDMALFKALRAVPDVVLVGATTVIVEDYRPLTLDEDRRSWRVSQGMTPAPRLAIVSGTMSLDVEQRVFSDSEHKPIVVTGPDANPGRLAMLGDAADVVILVDLTPAAILEKLEGDVVLLEGGPSLTGQFIAAGLVDELNLTIAPMLIGGDSKRLTGPATPRPPYGMRLDRVATGEKMLFLRYLRA